MKIKNEVDLSFFGCFFFSGGGGGGVFWPKNGALNHVYFSVSY